MKFYQYSYLIDSKKKEKKPRIYELSLFTPVRAC